MGKLVFITDDEPAIQRLLAFWLQTKWGYRVKTFREGLKCLDSMDENPDLILLDIMLPDINGLDLLKMIKSRDQSMPVIMLSAQGSIEVAVNTLKSGAFDYFSKPIDTAHLELVVKNAIKQHDLENELKKLKEEAISEYKFSNIISVDKKMLGLFSMMGKVLNNDISVLIQGESGTGKELIARAIHYNGTRKMMPFIVVNCASIPRELMETELFGHEKGAFTGAYQKKIGKFELAKDSTIFLDEIGEMDMALQAKILRVIQQKEFERVGGNELIKTDVRIISATNRNLREAVEARQFREDLYYRLNAFPITVPPLRERRSDILVLTNHFIEVCNLKLGRHVKGLTKRALKLMFDYSWPGNVRELENTVERSVILCDGDFISEDLLPSAMLNGETKLGNSVFGPDSPVIPFEALKEEAVRHALKRTEGNIAESAKKLRLGRATLYRLMEKYGLSK